MEAERLENWTMTPEEITKANIDKYITLVASVDPELYRIKMALEDTQLNPVYLPSIIRAIANIAYGTGFGEVKIHMRAGVITHIRPEESDQIDLPAILIATVE